MTSIIDLELRNVSKRYRVRQESGGATSQNGLMRQLKSLYRGHSEFWAVKDVSFAVKRGEALGIIGHNGAGKSTILKLLSNITAPTSGVITINGRLSALIEVGSGFHPELTGRENIYLSGSILGMRRREITDKLDRIIDFAGVRQFIDTPVKRYSSGMYVRLGFAIAAHLDPDVLLLDEVLAVGDASFQAKCMHRIFQLKKKGTTIVFISHDLSSVGRLCDRALLLNEGRVAASGMPTDVIVEYKSISGEASLPLPVHESIAAFKEWQSLDESPGTEVVRLRKARVRTEDGKTTPTIDIRHPVGIEATYEVLEEGHILTPNFHFYNEDGVQLFAVQDVSSEWRRRPRPVGQYVSTAWIPGNFFSEGSLKVGIAVNTYIPALLTHVFEHDTVAFRIIDRLEPDSARGDYTGPVPGVIRPIVNWTTRFDVQENIGEAVWEQVKA